MSIQYDKITKAWLSEFAMSTNENLTEQERKTYFIKAMFDEEIYRKAIKEFHEEGGFGYIATQDYLNRYVEITELTKWQGIKGNKRLVDPTVYAAFLPNAEKNIAIFICKDENETYIPLDKNNEVHWKFCEKLNSNPKKYQLEKISASKISALQFLLAHNEKSERTSVELINWLEHKGSTLEAIICQNISNIVENFMKSEDATLRDVGKYAACIYLDPAFRKQSSDDNPTKRLTEHLNISKSHLMRVKKKCISKISQELFPVPLDGKSKIDSLAFADSNELIPYNIDASEVHELMGGFRFKYIIEEQVLRLKSLIDKGAISENEFLQAKIDFDEKSILLEEVQDNLSNIEDSLQLNSNALLKREYENYKHKRASVVEELLNITSSDGCINNVAITIDKISRLLKLKQSDVQYILPQDKDLIQYTEEGITGIIENLSKIKSLLGKERNYANRRYNSRQI